MTEPNPETVADRLAAAGVRVKPLESDGKLYWTADVGLRHYSVYPESLLGGHVFVARVCGVMLGKGLKAECIAACEAHHDAAVLAMLEPIPSEDAKP